MAWGWRLRLCSAPASLRLQSERCGAAATWPCLASSPRYAGPAPLNRPEQAPTSAVDGIIAEESPELALHRKKRRRRRQPSSNEPTEFAMQKPAAPPRSRGAAAKSAGAAVANLYAARQRPASQPGSRPFARRSPIEQFKLKDEKGEFQHRALRSYRRESVSRLRGQSALHFLDRCRHRVLFKHSAFHRERLAPAEGCGPGGGDDQLFCLRLPAA